MSSSQDRLLDQLNEDLMKGRRACVHLNGQIRKLRSVEAFILYKRDDAKKAMEDFVTGLSEKLLEFRSDMLMQLRQCVQEKKDEMKRLKAEFEADLDSLMHLCSETEKLLQFDLGLTTILDTEQAQRLLTLFRMMDHCVNENIPVEELIKLEFSPSVDMHCVFSSSFGQIIKDNKPVESDGTLDALSKNIQRETSNSNKDCSTCRFCDMEKIDKPGRPTGLATDQQKTTKVSSVSTQTDLPFSCSVNNNETHRRKSNQQGPFSNANNSCSYRACISPSFQPAGINAGQAVPRCPIMPTAVDYFSYPYCQYGVKSVMCAPPPGFTVCPKSQQSLSMCTALDHCASNNPPCVVPQPVVQPPHASTGACSQKIISGNQQGNMTHIDNQIHLSPYPPSFMQDSLVPSSSSLLDISPANSGIHVSSNDVHLPTQVTNTETTCAGSSNVLLGAEKQLNTATLFAEPQRTQTTAASPNAEVSVNAMESAITRPYESVESSFQVANNVLSTTGTIKAKCVESTVKDHGKHVKAESQEDENNNNTTVVNKVNEAEDFQEMSELSGNFGLKSGVDTRREEPCKKEFEGKMIDKAAALREKEILCSGDSKVNTCPENPVVCSLFEESDPPSASSWLKCLRQTEEQAITCQPLKPLRRPLRMPKVMMCIQPSYSKSDADSLNTMADSGKESTAKVNAHKTSHNSKEMPSTSVSENVQDNDRKCGKERMIFEKVDLNNFGSSTESMDRPSAAEKHVSDVKWTRTVIVSSDKQCIGKALAVEDQIEDSKELQKSRSDEWYRTITVSGVKPLVNKGIADVNQTLANSKQQEKINSDDRNVGKVEVDANLSSSSLLKVDIDTDTTQDSLDKGGIISDKGGSCSLVSEELDNIQNIDAVLNDTSKQNLKTDATGRYKQRLSDNKPEDWGTSSDENNDTISEAGVRGDFTPKRNTVDGSKKRGKTTEERKERLRNQTTQLKRCVRNIISNQPPRDRTDQPNRSQETALQKHWLKNTSPTKLKAKFLYQFGQDLHFAIGVKTNKQNQSIVTDTGNNVVKIFDSEGKLVQELGQDAKPILWRPSAVVVNEVDEIFVKDDICVRMFDKKFRFVRNIGKELFSKPYEAGCLVSVLTRVIDEQDFSVKFHHVRGLAMTPAQRLLVLDTDGRKPALVHLSPDGVDSWTFVYGPLVQASRGSKCRFLAVSNKTAIVSDLGLSVVYLTNLEGMHYHTIGFYGSGPNEFNEPSDVSVDRYGNMVIGDSRNNRVKMFHHDGTYMGTIDFDDSIVRPSGIHLTADNRLLVVNYLKHKVKVYQLQL